MHASSSAAEFLSPRNHLDCAEKKLPVELQNSENDHIQDLHECNPHRLAHRSHVLEGSDHCHLCAVQPRAEFCVSAIVVRKLVSEDGAKLRNVQRPQEWEPKSHDATAAESHEAAAICYPCVGFADQINLTRQRFLQGGCDAIEFANKRGCAARSRGTPGGTNLSRRGASTTTWTPRR
jgi:hypothetical protein